MRVEWANYKNDEGQFDGKGKKVDSRSKDFVQGKPAMPYNINDLGPKLLKDRLGLDEKFASVVNNLRKKTKYNTPDILFERMDAFYSDKSNEKIKFKNRQLDIIDDLLNKGLLVIK